jgi:hypothetical protein
MRGGKRAGAGRPITLSDSQKLEVAHFYEREYQRRLRAVHSKIIENTPLAKIRENHKLLAAIPVCEREAMVDGDDVQDIIAENIELMRTLGHQQLDDAPTLDVPEPPRRGWSVRLPKTSTAKARREALTATADHYRALWPAKFRRTDGARLVLKCLTLKRFYNNF